MNDHARPAVFLRYAAGNVMRKELVKLCFLPKRTQEIDIHNTVRKGFLSNDIRSEKVVSITSDGAPSMVGTLSRLYSYLL